MTSTSFNIGLEGEARSSSKVLKPPGGGSSDIFGSDAEPRRARNTNHLQSSVFGNMMETTASKSKLSTTSNTTLFGDEPAANSPDDHKNLAPSQLFFDVESKERDEAMEMAEAVASKVDDDMTKGIDLSKIDLVGEPIAVLAAPETIQARESRRNPINHNGMTAADCTQSCLQRSRTYQQKPVGNPVTGEGYSIANGVKEMAAVPVSAPAPVSSPMTNGSGPKTNDTAPSVGSLAPAKARGGRVPPGGYSSGLW